MTCGLASAAGWAAAGAANAATRARAAQGAGLLRRPVAGGAAVRPLSVFPTRPCLGRRDPEHRDRRPAPVRHPLAVAEAPVDVQVPPLHGVVPVRVVPVAVLVKPLAQ